MTTNMLKFLLSEDFKTMLSCCHCLLSVVTCVVACFRVAHWLCSDTKHSLWSKSTLLQTMWGRAEPASATYVSLPQAKLLPHCHHELTEVRFSHPVPSPWSCVTVQRAPPARKASKFLPSGCSQTPSCTPWGQWWWSLHHVAVAHRNKKDQPKHLVLWI